jgi:hypothetical protein
VSDVYAGLAPVVAMFACLGLVFLAVFGYQRFKRASQDDDV